MMFLRDCGWQVESKEQTEDGLVMTRTGKLHMVDLAGSECAKSAGTEDAKQVSHFGHFLPGSCLRLA